MRLPAGRPGSLDSVPNSNPPAHLEFHLSSTDGKNISHPHGLGNSSRLRRPPPISRSVSRAMFCRRQAPITSNSPLERNRALQPAPGKPLATSRKRFGITRFGRRTLAKPLLTAARSPPHQPQDTSRVLRLTRAEARPPPSLDEDHVDHDRTRRPKQSRNGTWLRGR